VAKLGPKRILETAAGTGIVTQALAVACPDAEIVATDLNQAMLDVAAQRRGCERVRFVAADAQQLPFDGGSFDLVVCQFGIMFYPDKQRGNAEARRVLRDGGAYLLVIWDRLENNPASQIVHDAVSATFPDNPPQFLARTPFGYSDPAQIEQDLLSAGFTDIEFETVRIDSLPGPTPQSAAEGLVYGSPLRAELEPRGPSALQRAAQNSAAALQSLVREGNFQSRLSAHVVTAIK
jgi:ubiquinone/menaquinone biosynthesis C-methylase UbiE